MGGKNQWKPLTGGLGYMGISLNSKKHKEDSLAAMVDWVNSTSNFTQIRIGLSDTLNRHTYANDQRIDLSAAFSIARGKGDEWVNQNKPILDELTVPYEFFRWTHWFDNHADEIQTNKQKFIQLFHSDSNFKRAIEQDIAGFLNRKQGLAANEIGNESFQACFNFLIEELAVYSVIFKDYPATLIYPGPELKCLTYLRNEIPQNIPQAVSNTNFIKLGIFPNQKQQLATNDDVALRA